MAGAQTAEQPYPNRVVRVLVGVPPGGSTDLLTRMFAGWLKDSMGQPTIVDNRPGANTAVAAAALASAPPDGYTLLVATDAFITVPLLLSKSLYDPFKGFTPIGTVTISPFVFAIHPDVPAKSMKELVAYAKANPGKMFFGSSGNGGASHLGLEKFKAATGVDITHVPFKGAGPALIDAVAGRIQIVQNTPLALVPHITAGKLRPLAVTIDQRVPVLPDVPTMAEAGMGKYRHSAWLGVFAPAGLPKAISDRLAAEIVKMVANPEIKAKLAGNGVAPFISTPEQMAKMMRDETARARSADQGGQDLVGLKEHCPCPIR